MTTGCFDSGNSFILCVWFGVLKFCDSLIDMFNSFLPIAQRLSISLRLASLFSFSRFFVFPISSDAIFSMFSPINFLAPSFTSYSLISFFETKSAYLLSDRLFKLAFASESGGCDCDFRLQADFSTSFRYSTYPLSLVIVFVLLLYQSGWYLLSTARSACFGLRAATCSLCIFHWYSETSSFFSSILLL